VNTVSIDSVSGFFAQQFTIEFMNRKQLAETIFAGNYYVTVYTGPQLYADTSETKVAIGIFISNRKGFNFDQDRPIIRIWADDLFSANDVMKEAKRAANYIFNLIKMIDDKKIRSIKTPV
jgi:hypothetical protein